MVIIGGTGDGIDGKTEDIVLEDSIIHIGDITDSTTHIGMQDFMVDFTILFTALLFTATDITVLTEDIIDILTIDIIEITEDLAI
jgi:hypothetical protein